MGIQANQPMMSGRSSVAGQVTVFLSRILPDAFFFEMEGEESIKEVKIDKYHLT